MKNYLRGNFRHDLTYLLLGTTVTFIFAGTIGTIGGALLVLSLLVLPAELAAPLTARLSDPLRNGLFITALIEILGWIWLRRMQFVSRTLMQSMLVALGGITLVSLGAILSALI